MGTIETTFLDVAAQNNGKVGSVDTQLGRVSFGAKLEHSCDTVRAKGTVGANYLIVLGGGGAASFMPIFANANVA